MLNPKLLVADDQSHIRESLTLLLEPEGYEILEASTPAATLTAITQASFDLVLMDMNYSKDTTSGDEGIELIRQIRQQDADLPIIVMTAWANIELSVSALKAGANDFIEKPWSNTRLLSVIRTIIELSSEKQSNARLSQLAQRSGDLESLIAVSDSIQPVITLIERTAASDANILLTGESGVGKSLFATVIHNLSGRQAAPLVSVNMGALSDTLFESELFGHQKGAFTDARESRVGRFEMADKGTLFLDEIANIPKGLQGKLLRVLESGEYESLGSSKTKRADVRIISASNVDFGTEVEAGNFRQDLLYRLNTITIDIPPLRQRVADIEPLAASFLTQFSQKYRRPELTFSQAAVQKLSQHPWPGNVRELSHCVERAVLMAPTDEIGPGDLGLVAASGGNEQFTEMTLEQAEKYLITHAVEASEGNIQDAADKLGISRAALYRRLEKYEDLSLQELKG